MPNMGQAEFADQVRERRGRLAQNKLAVLSGVSKSTIERLETKRGDAPKIGRYQAIDLAAALGWDVDEALGVLGEDPLSDRERAELESAGTRRAKLDRLWPYLAPRQQHALVELIAAMVTEDAPETPPPTNRPPVGGRRGLELTPGVGEIPGLSGPRDKGSALDDL